MHTTSWLPILLLLLTAGEAADNSPIRSQSLAESPSRLASSARKVGSFFRVDFGRGDVGGCGNYLEKIESGYEQAIKAISSAYQATTVLNERRPGTDDTDAFNDWMRVAQAVQDMFSVKVPGGGTTGSDTESLAVKKIRNTYAIMLDAHTAKAGQDMREFELKCNDDWLMPLRPNDVDPTDPPHRIKENPRVQRAWATAARPRVAKEAGIPLTRDELAVDGKQHFLYSDVLAEKVQQQSICRDDSVVGSYLPRAEVITICPAELEQPHWSLEQSRQEISVPISRGSSLNELSRTMAAVFIREIGASSVKLRYHGKTKKNFLKKTVLDSKTQTLGWTDSFDLADHSQKLATESASNYVDFALAMYFSQWQWVGREGKAVAVEKTRGPNEADGAASVIGIDAAAASRRLPLHTFENSC